MKLEHFAFLARLLKDRSGLILPEEHAYLLESRLLPVIRKWKLANIVDAVQAIADRPDEALVRDVVEAMTSSDTFFFRSRQTFNHIRDEALPALLRKRPANRPIRIWSAACSTGQEAYSIVMLLCELGLDLSGGRVEIVATDISADSLARAREGAYSQFEVQRGLPVRLLLRHFDQIGERWQLKPKLRTLTVFRNFNLLSDPAPLGYFDIVLCRNVLVYFDAETQARVLDRIAERLPDDGVLYLGADEEPAGVGGRFQPIPRQAGAYALKAPKTYLTAVGAA